MINQFSLSKYELWFLVSQKTNVSIIGLKNPIEGYLSEDIFPLMQEVSQSLLDKELIYIDHDYKIKIKEELERVLQVITDAQHTLLIVHKISSEKKEIVRSINFQGNQMAALEEGLDGFYSLHEIASKDDLVFMVMEPFLEKMYWAPDTEHFLISEENLTLVHGAMEKSDLDFAKAFLYKANGDEQSKAHFFETLQSQCVRFSLLEFKNWKDPQKNHLRGFSVISNERYIWLLDLVDVVDKMVNVSKITIKSLKQNVLSIASSLLGE